MKNTEYYFSAIILSAGNSSRLGDETRKPFIHLMGKPLIHYSLLAFENCPDISEIIIVGQKDDEEKVFNICQKSGIAKFKGFAIGGKTRQQSAFEGVKAASSLATHFIIHDGARPLISPETISLVAQKAKIYRAAIASVPAKDTIKLRDHQGFVKNTLPRNELALAQTPQAFEKDLYIRAMNRALENQTVYTDDCQLIENLGEKVFLCEGDYSNIKITTGEDLLIAEKIIHNRGGSAMRIGHGYDFHKLVEGRKLILGGVDIPHKKGLDGHSDADVLIHAIIDSLLGAAGMGDIGKFFPDSDNTYLGADSLKLLKIVCSKVYSAKYSIINIDCSIIAEEPKLSSHIEAIKENISQICAIAKSQINIKATSEEGLGPIGQCRAIAAHAVTLLSGACS
jgi:2-C-methyl-D-erythritol 4-phosphate cytidylyltransferase/2-C-methyl-D-erythritol 2,4-cyclodiphosphate synthase